MDTHSSEEKVKPFRLVKYFTFTSLTVIFIGTLLLSLLNTHLARTMQQKKSEEYAHLLIENLNHPLHSFKIDMVNIYDINNTISYSFDTSVIGKEDAGGKGYQDALSGKSTSKLFQRGNWFEILLGFSQHSKLITFAPLRAEQPLSRISGPVLGVVEIVQDLTEDYKAIFSFQIRIITTCTVVMGVLFLVLLFVVKRGEAIIEKRALERIRLKEQLSHSEHLSSLGEMVAGISHEIRNPLGIIMSSSELLKKKMSDYDPSNPIPSIIIEESSRLNNIITDFLNFAKPRTPHLISCKIEDIIEKNITFLASQTKGEGYTIDKHYDNKLPEITADPDMLYQAFLNILINAMQAMPQGGKINVQICSNDNAVEIIFEDHGEGIAEDILEKIWDPFFTTKSKGTGLGLGIVKNIIESHGGSVQINNRSQSGARVTVKIPVEQGV
jgi:signal transduction histidine kinase